MLTDNNNDSPFDLTEYRCGIKLCKLVEENSFISEKCEGDFHIFNGDSESESPVFWNIKIG